jgi:hypothetical protein
MFFEVLWFRIGCKHAKKNLALINDTFFKKLFIKYLHVINFFVYVQNFYFFNYFTRHFHSLYHLTPSQTSNRWKQPFYVG